MSFLKELADLRTSKPPTPAAEIGLVSKWMRENWRGLFAELRSREPVCTTAPFTFVTRWADVVRVLSEHQLFSVRGYASKMDDSVGPFMLARDETPINWDEKSLMKSLLRMDDLTCLRVAVGRVAADSLSSSGELELVGRVGRLVPLRIVQRYFGFPGPEEPDGPDKTMLRWSKATQWDMFRNPANNPEVHAGCVRAGTEMRDYLRKFLLAKIDETKKLDKQVVASTSAYDASTSFPTPAPALPQDVVSRLMRVALCSYPPLDFERIVSNVCGLLVGSIETTSQAIVQAAEQILKLPADKLDMAIRAARIGAKEFDGIVWEALRFNPIAPLVARYCERDTTIAGVTIKKGAIVAACTASAMFDDSVFPDPEKVKWDRPLDSYMHFGFGHHECLGKHVGMVAVPEAVRQILLVPCIHLLPDSAIDFKDGPFPERFVVGRGTGKRASS